MKRFKIKTISLIVAILSFLYINGYSQNRINDWDTGKITSIQIKIKTTDNKVELIKLENKIDIDAVFSFLKQIDFKEIKNLNFDKDKILSKRLIEMTFQGQHDQVIFCKDYATIGKTIFSIDNQVIKDLKRIIINCKE